MVGQEQLESSPLCQHSDNEPEAKRECSVVIPDDWQLTSQQQALYNCLLKMISRNNNYHHSYYPFLMNYRAFNTPQQ